MTLKIVTQLEVKLCLGMSKKDRRVGIEWCCFSSVEMPGICKYLFRRHVLIVIMAVHNST